MLHWLLREMLQIDGVWKARIAFFFTLFFASCVAAYGGFLWHPSPWWEINQINLLMQALVSFLCVWTCVFCFVFSFKKKEWKFDGVVLLLIGLAGIVGLGSVMYMGRPQYVVQVANQAIEVEASTIVGEKPKTRLLNTGPQWFTLNKSILVYANAQKAFEKEVKNPLHWKPFTSVEGWQRGEVKENGDKELVVVGVKSKALVSYNETTKQLKVSIHER